MSDHVDNTDKIIFAEVTRGLAAVRSRPALVARMAAAISAMKHWRRPCCSAAWTAATITTRSKRPRPAPGGQDDRHAALAGRAGRDSPAVPDCPSHRISRP
ncbi:hypothetical protein HDE74_001846 [Janthinobacterium sp. K2Li3]|nr:hypothetical protein [Janthinobacterium sp. K2C7]MBB5381133.1 hypothetical protein [Janthinobacterium sp. K2Li3]MBB5387714.1 hypothetical protein [Janthinobacterium sp. K2E3]